MNVLITGGSRGIGRAVCIQLAKQGCNVVVNYCHDEAAAAETVALCKAENANAVAVQADVSTAEGCKKLFEEAGNAFGRVDILVNNAGITRDNLILRLTEEDFDAVLDANLNFMMKTMLGGKIQQALDKAVDSLVDISEGRMPQMPEGML